RARKWQLNSKFNARTFFFNVDWQFRVISAALLTTGKRIFSLFKSVLLLYFVCVFLRTVLSIAIILVNFYLRLYDCYITEEPKWKLLIMVTVLGHLSFGLFLL